MSRSILSLPPPPPPAFDAAAPAPAEGVLLSPDTLAAAARAAALTVALISARVGRAFDALSALLSPAFAARSPEK